MHDSSVIELMWTSCGDPALVEAIDFITERTTNPDGRALRDAEAMADARVRLLETD